MQNIATKILFLLVYLFATNIYALEARITNMVDFDFGAVLTSAGTQEINATVCAYSSGASAGYSIRANSLYPSGINFRLKHTTNAYYIKYKVFYDDVRNGSGALELNENITLTGQTVSKTNCKNSYLKISIDGAELSSALSGLYQDTLSLTITAN